MKSRCAVQSGLPQSGTSEAPPPPVISAVDLFCGIGGLTHGLARAGVRVVAGVDIDASCRFPYEANNASAFLTADVRGLNAEYIASKLLPNSLRLLAGCAPCQPFSTYTRSRHRKNRDGRWDLLLDFARLIRDVQPELVTMENVPQLAKCAVFQAFLQSLAGYCTWYSVVQCAEYGVPQTRNRLILLASKLGKIDLVEPTHPGTQRPTLRDAIFGLPAIRAGESDATDVLHTAPTLSPLNLRRIRASTPGGSWRNWPISLRAACHRRKSGETYPSVYGRMDWYSPAPTMTTQCFGYGNGRFGHPEQNRAISLREAALIQTFPRSYRLVPPHAKVVFKTIGRQIGNAVPVRIGEVVGESFVRHIRNFWAANL